MSTTETFPLAHRDEKKNAQVKINSPLAGMLWFSGWLFTIGFAKLVWWQVLLGLVLWPYWLGLALH